MAVGVRCIRDTLKIQNQYMWINATKEKKCDFILCYAAYKCSTFHYLFSVPICRELWITGISGGSPV